MTHSNNRRTHIQGDRRTSIQGERQEVYPAPSDPTSNRQQTVYDRESELSSQDLVNRNPSVGNGTRAASPSSYQNGYVQGRVSGQAYEERLRARDDDSASRGLLLGVLLTSLLGLVVGALFFVNQQSQTPAPVVPVPVPAEPEEPNTETNNIEIRERVIERTRELVPVPQPQSPAPQQPAADPAPAAPPASSTAQPEAPVPEVAQPEGTAPTAPDANSADPAQQ